MKKFLLFLGSIFLVFSFINSVAASTIGHDVLNRNGADNWNNFSMIDTSLQFTNSGVIDSWSIWAEKTGSIYLQTFEFVSGTNYKLTGQNFFTILSTGLNTLDAGSLSYKSGDFIGWTSTDPAILSYNKPSDEPGSVIWYQNGASVTTIDDPFTFTGGEDRTYSISATLSPVPEPATIALFGIGLLGLARINRRKK